MSKQQRRGQKYPKRIFDVTDPAIRDAFYEATDPIALINRNQVVCGIIQHPDTGYWQLWVSTNGHDITCLSAQLEQEAALADLDAFKTLAATPSPPDQRAIDALLARSIEPPRPLSDDQVRHLFREISRNAAHRPPSPKIN